LRHRAQRIREQTDFSAEKRREEKRRKERTEGVEPMRHILPRDALTVRILFESAVFVADEAGRIA
jgi:hypothetical protein